MKQFNRALGLEEDMLQHMTTKHLIVYYIHSMSSNFIKNCQLIANGLLRSICWMCYNFIH